MANRPIFIPQQKNHGVIITPIEFMWHSGMATSQKQKSIHSLHEKAMQKGCVNSLLEISTKSTHELGKKTSAFTLSIETSKGVFPLECVYHASKIFPVVGLQESWMYLTVREAKKQSQQYQEKYGKPIGSSFEEFIFVGQSYQLGFTYMYFQSLKRLSDDERTSLCSFGAFTDINYLPEKGGNCQAHAAALFVSFVRNGIDSPWEIDPDTLEEYL